MKSIQVLLIISLVVVLIENVRCQSTLEPSGVLSTEFVEEGRTFVHHTIKRLAMILPAVFFKLGIAFSLLLLVTIVAINNGFIGFLLLIVGVSSVLARLQEARRPLPVPLSYPAPLPLAHYGGHHHHFLDRNDDATKTQEVKTPPTFTNTPSPYGAYAPVNPTYGYAHNENYDASGYSGTKYYTVTS